jgi:hypothetical protein
MGTDKGTVSSVCFRGKAPNFLQARSADGRRTLGLPPLLPAAAAPDSHDGLREVVEDALSGSGSSRLRSRFMSEPGTGMGWAISRESPLAARCADLGGLEGWLERL